MITGTTPHGTILILFFPLNKAWVVLCSPNLTKICCWLPLVGASVAAKSGYDFGFLQRVLQPSPFFPLQYEITAPESSVHLLVLGFSPG
jgi:hypothetical protein